MSALIKILKFGGTSVEDWLAFERAANIVRANADAALVVIVSAMSGVTDALIAAFRRAASGERAEALQSLEKHFERHLKVASNLSVSSLAKTQGLIEETRREITKLLNVAATNGSAASRIQDAIISYGEQLSANVLTLTLEHLGIPASYVDARRCIVTNHEHGSAKPLMGEVSRRTKHALKPVLETRRVPVLGGFIGATEDGITTTLGRGSSDYSATLIGFALGAREIQIWTDVNGVQTADPKLVKSARTVPRISYEEAAELARLGARLIHPKMIEPIVEQKVSILIRNARDSEQSGTLICANSGPAKDGVKAIACRTNLTTFEITSTPAFVGNGLLAEINEVFTRYKTNVDIVARSRVHITFATEHDTIAPSLVQDLKRLGSVEIERERAIVGCVGDGLHNGAGSVTTIVNLLGIDASLTWQSTSNSNLLAVVDRHCLRSIVRRLHEAIFECDWPRGQSAPREQRHEQVKTNAG